MKVYRLSNPHSNKLWNKTYTLGGLKAALRTSYWCNTMSSKLEVVEYELKEVRRLSLDEAKQLNTKDSNNKYVELLQIARGKSFVVEFESPTAGTVWFGLGEGAEFNTLDEAIESMNKH